MKRTMLLAGIAALVFPQTASAHLVSTRFGELYSGLLHPLLALEHVVPWLGLGLLAALTRNTTSRWALASFPLAVAFGAWLGSVGPVWPVLTTVNIASFVVVGVLIIANVRLGTATLLMLTIVMGLSHGYANAAPTLGGYPLVLFVLGVALSAYLIITLVTGFGHLLATQQRWGVIAVRAAGSWIVAIGLVFGGFSILNIAA
ncbi:MAG: HupE/UreJ family protein [Pseudomonadota bacterium]